MTRFAKTTGGTLLLLTMAALVFWFFARQRFDTLTKGIKLEIEHEVLDSRSPGAESELLLTHRLGGTPKWDVIEQGFADCVMKSLQTPDNLFWKPYTVIRTNAPGLIGKWLPPWREPRRVRQAAAWWLSSQARWPNASPAPAKLNPLAAPVLCRLAKLDPDPEVRKAALWAVGDLAVFSNESLEMMLQALVSSASTDRTAATRFFARNPVLPERIVPLLVRGLEDDAMRSDYAEALRAYGASARFAIEPIRSLACTNDRATVSVASWALEAIDPGSSRGSRASQPDPNDSNEPRVDTDKHR